MFATDNSQSVDDFCHKMAETFDRLSQTGEAEVLTVNGEARAVLISPAVYDEMAREAHAAGFRRALKQHACGDSMELDAFMDTVRSELLTMRGPQAFGEPK